MLHALATPVNAHTAAPWGALKVCHVDNDTYCRCPRQDELLTRSASRWGLSMWILILKTPGGAGAGGQNGHSNHNHALFIERAHAAPRGESAVERETADVKPTNTSTQAAPRSNITCSHRMTNAVLTATIRAGICHLDHRPYPGESSGGGAAGSAGHRGCCRDPHLGSPKRRRSAAATCRSTERDTHTTRATACGSPTSPRWCCSPETAPETAPDPATQQPQWHSRHQR